MIIAYFEPYNVTFASIHGCRIEYKRKYDYLGSKPGRIQFARVYGKVSEAGAVAQWN